MAVGFKSAVVFETFVSPKAGIPQLFHAKAPKQQASGWGKMVLKPNTLIYNGKIKKI